MVSCPTCNKCLEFQSKAGECTLEAYTKELVPLEIAKDLLDQVEECPKCHSKVRLELGTQVTAIKMNVYIDN